MAYKRVTFTFPDWICEQYLNDIKRGKSSFVAEMFVKGCEAELNSTSTNKIQLIEMLKINKSLQEENKKLMFQIGGLKVKASRRLEKEQSIRNTAFRNTINRKMMQDIEEAEHNDK